MAIPAWFDEYAYLNSKLNQLTSSGETDYTTINQVKTAILNAGFTSTYEHFAAYSLAERTSPNEYFNTNEYLAAKAEQMGGTWTADKVALAFQNAGYTNAYDHFVAWGWQEGVNPSNAFDISLYLESKAAESGLTVDEVIDAFAAAGLDPISHYLLYGQDEAGVTVSDVPASEQVDPDSTSGSAGQTFTLTTGIDSFTGSNSDDSFIGDAGSAGLADTLVGGAGNDTLKLYGNAAKPNISGIENVFLSGNTAGFDVSSNADVTSLQLVDPTTAQTYTTAQGQAVSVATMIAGEAITFAGNTVTSLGMTLNDVAATGADVTVNLTGTKLASLGITTTTKASQVTLTNAGGLLSAITVTGDQALELGSALTTIASIDASASTGAVNIDAVGAYTGFSFKGGTGNDRIDIAATLGATDVILGGTGTDTFAISDADLLTTAIAVGVKEFEVLEVTTADGTAYNVDNIITNNPLTGVVISETGGAGTVVSNINSAAINNIKFTNDTPTAITLSGKGFLSGGTSDASTIILDESLLDHADGVDIATSLTYTNVDRLTVNVTSDDTTAARAIVNSIAALTATDLDTLTITGNAAVNIATAAATAVLGEIDASASTGAVTVNTSAAATAAIIYRGNAKVDTFTANDAATNTATLFTGGGSDVLQLGVTGAAHTLNFTATDFTTGDVLAGNAITINTGNAFQAGDTVTFNFSSAIEGALKSAGTTLSSATSNVVLVGTAFSATTNVIAIDGGNNTTLQFDLNGDGSFTAAADFSIEILGLANNTLNYIAATDVFTFTAAA